ncbi:MAG: uracil-DNA glycosylase [Bacteriovoracaceae bacterium]|nr:uracil-DNA glycosylase [Bacteriovoracaceae bacterium]
MDYSKFFFKINKDQKKTAQKGELSFAQDLYKETSWFFHFKKRDEGEALVKAPLAQVKTTEKDLLLKSFKEFTEKKISQKKDQEKVLRFTGGELQLKASLEEQVTEKEIIIPLCNISDLQKKMDACALCPQEKLKYRTKVVHGLVTQRTQDIQVLFVGDFPRDNKEENFPTEVEALLQKMIKAMQLSQEQFLLSLMARCYHPEPEVSLQMISSCESYLYQEIFLLKPQVVVTLGSVATQYVLGVKEKLSQIHGKFFDKKIKNTNNEIFSFKVVPLFHPEYLLINPTLKQTAWQDMQKIMEFIGKKKA